jgi:hypothetical protein
MPWAAAAAIGGAYLTSSATSDAADAQAASSAAAQAENAREFDKIQQNQQPWLDAGQRALGSLETGINTPLDPSTVALDPGYKFGLDQGMQALDRKTAAAGGRISGAALKAATQYGTNYATTGYDAAYNRTNQARSDRLNRLAALAGVGQTATQQVNSAGQTFAGANGNIMTAQGNAAGAAAMAQGNIWGNTGNQLAALYSRGGIGITPPVTDGGYSVGQGSAYGGTYDTSGNFTPYRAGM